MRDRIEHMVISGIKRLLIPTGDICANPETRWIGIASITLRGSCLRTGLGNSEDDEDYHPGQKKPYRKQCATLIRRVSPSRKHVTVFYPESSIRISRLRIICFNI